MELIDHFYKSLAPASTGQPRERLAFLLHMCPFRIEITLKSNQKNKRDWPELEGKDEKWLFTAACLPWLPQQQRREQSITASLNTVMQTESEWSRKEVWVSWVYWLCVSPETHSDIRVSCCQRRLSHAIAVCPPQRPGWRPSATGDEGQRALWLCHGHEHSHRVLLRQPGWWCVALHQYRLYPGFDWILHGPVSAPWCIDHVVLSGIKK